MRGMHHGLFAKSNYRFRVFVFAKKKRLKPLLIFLQWSMLRNIILPRSDAETNFLFSRFILRLLFVG